MTMIIEYRHLFSEPRPNPQQLIIGIPSRFVIGIMAIINDALLFEVPDKEIQMYLFETLLFNTPLRSKTSC
jgi:hypothetical protein